MKVYVNVKAAGKRENILTKKPYMVPEDISSLRALLSWFTRYEVEVFNRGDENREVPVLDMEELLQGAQVGKIGFGHRYGAKKADPDEAVEVTISAWEDGLVRVFLNEEELTGLEEKICLKEEDTLTFVRLTFLAGRMW